MVHEVCPLLSGQRAEMGRGLLHLANDSDHCPSQRPLHQDERAFRNKSFATESAVRASSAGFKRSSSSCAPTVLIRQEFATRDLDAEEKSATKLHIVELGPECDHVQGKVSTHRYLLALLVPSALIGAFTGGAKGKKAPDSPRYRNESVLDAGKVSLKTTAPGEWHLLVSCRCFMALASQNAIQGQPSFRLRRALIEEVAHRYVTYARRPGVMRFHG
jgi:hypothetical protein